MPFVYRLQKILDFRIRKKEEQLLVVQKAQQEVYLAEQRIRENEEEIQQTIQNRKNSDYKMMEYFDKYLHHLWDKADALKAELDRVQAILDEEKMKLVKLEQAVKVLEKHKEKQKELYLEEQKAIEASQNLNEQNVTKAPMFVTNMPTETPVVQEIPAEPVAIDIPEVEEIQ